MSQSLGIAILGCGTVGSGVAKLLMGNRERIASRAGRDISIRRIVIRDPSKTRPDDLPKNLFSTNLADALADPLIDVVVELVGGTTWAREAVLAGLSAGKHVVTANKALLAVHGTEIFSAAHRAGKSVAFEASVAGGVPVIAALGQGLAANEIHSLQGILNGTCNFILTAMTEQGQSYSSALAEAQRQGFAEADPTLDVDGSDAAHKLAILVRLAFGFDVSPGDVTRRGIAELSPLDIRFAKELGYTIKLLAEAWRDGRELALHVEPVLVKHGTPLALVRGPYNAVQIVGDAVGDIVLFGRGAGMMPTASAVVADLIDVATGRAQKTFESLRLWDTESMGIRIKPAGDVRSRHYLRLTVADEPGVLAEISRDLAAMGISISSVIQHEGDEGPELPAVSLVIMTHTAPTGQLLDALARINAHAQVREPAVYYPVGD